MASLKPTTWPRGPIFSESCISRKPFMQATQHISMPCREMCSQTYYPWPPVTGSGGARKLAILARTKNPPLPQDVSYTPDDWKNIVKNSDAGSSARRLHVATMFYHPPGDHQAPAHEAETVVPQLHALYERIAGGIGIEHMGEADGPLIKHSYSQETATKSLNLAVTFKGVSRKESQESARLCQF